MNLDAAYDRESLTLRLPDGAAIYPSAFPEPEKPADQLVFQTLENPFGAPRFEEALSRRRPGKVVVVVSDITRPIPYAAFLPQLLARMEAVGVPREDILILVATGMHRVSTKAEHIEMFGESVADQYAIIDHRADDPAELADVPGRTRSGNRITLNRHLVEAGFRMITGLVEPHFMAGFSGGRKAVCPGCASLDTVRNFHGQAFLSDPRACNARLEGNPLHLEALSVAEALGIDFSLNVVLNKQKQIAGAFAGALRAAHEAACAFVRTCACPAVETAADVAVTSSGGYPLDATFYQCVKGFVSCLPAVKPGGAVIAFGGCREGVGSPEYTELMTRYGGGRWPAFLEDIRDPDVFEKDQWQFQMHGRTLAHTGESGLHFVTAGLAPETLKTLSVNPHAVSGPQAVQETVQNLIDEAVRAGKTIAVFPEGPYCAPVSGERNTTE